MAAERALAIVVRGTDWSETSRITTLFTREFGKVRALAKGGRRLKSNFDVAFDLLTVCQIVFLRKASGGLDLLTEARLEEQFPALRQNLPALYAGYYVAELLADGTQDYDPHVPLFDAAVRTLRSLGTPTPPAPLPEGKGELALPSPLAGEGGESSSRMRGEPMPLGAVAPVVPLLSAPSPGGEAPPPSPARGEGKASSPFPSGRGAGGAGPSTTSAVSAFELVWLHELGYSPRLDACAGCGIERMNPSAAALYSPSAGGVLCPQCGPAVADRRGASGAALSALRALGAGGAVPELAPAVRTEVRHLLGPTVSGVLGRRPRLLGYVDGG